MPWGAGGKVLTVYEVIVPSVSVALRLEIVVVPALLEIAGVLVISLATGGLLPTGTVKVAGVASTAPLLSVAVKVNVLLPVNVPLGSKRNPAACAGVRTCPAVTTVTPSARNSVPCAAGGNVEMVYEKIVPSASLAARLEIVVGPAALGMVALMTLVAVGGLLPTGMVYVAGIASTAPLLSVAVKVNVLLPVNVPDGSNLRPAACAGVKTCSAVTAVVPSAKYKMPCATGGSVDTV